VKTKRLRKEELKKKTFLDVQISDLSDDLNDLGNVRLAFSIFFVLVALFLLYLALASLDIRNVHPVRFWFYVSCLPLYILMGIVTLRSINKFIRKTRNNYNEKVKERQAEEKVQDFLRKNLTEEYHIFENIYTGYGDIDTIVVGPTGIYMIEVKSNSGVITSNSKGYLSIIDGDTPNKNYRDQVKKQLGQVKLYLDINTGLNYWVNTVLVFPFGSVMKDLNLTSEYDNLILPVVDKKGLLKHIYAKNQAKLTSEQINKISKALEEWQKG
jgi:hypothetical protein